MESACSLTEVSFSSSSASSKASSSESTASSVNCVTVSDTDVSVPTRKKTKLLTKSTRTSWICELMYILFNFLWKYGKSHKNTEHYKYYTEKSKV